MRTALSFSLFFIVTSQILACNLAGNKQQSKKDSAITFEDEVVAKVLYNQSIKISSPFTKDTVYQVKCMGKPIEVRFAISQQNQGNTRKLLLLLPGWNYTDTQWCTRTNLCNYAQNLGYDLMFVEMGKSVYMDSLYPQMRKDYCFHPTRTWLFDSVMKPLMLRGYFTAKLPSFVLGLSTGGRGAMLLGLDHPGSFKAVASLSGDYDPTLNPSDNLMINCLGKYAEFSWRWKGSNNITNRISTVRIPCYIAHGTEDKVVPIEQARKLHEAFELAQSQADLARPANSHKKLPKFQFVELVGAGHSYLFWGDQGMRSIDFFEQVMKNSIESK